MDKENFRIVLNEITAHPDKWNQGFWHCGTIRCFLGHAQIKAGKPENVNSVFADATAFLGLTRSEGVFCASPQRTLGELKWFSHLTDEKRFEYVCRKVREDGNNGY